MQTRSFTATLAPRWRALRGGVAVLLAALVLNACQSAPPPKPPSLAERQEATLRALGFSRNDQGWLLNLPEPISFEFSKTELKPDLRTHIDGFSEQLLKVEIRKLRIEGHTDNLGPRDFNLSLSQQRAEAVAQEFIAHGFAESDVERVGLGPDHPTTGNDTREGRAQNRRVEIVIPANALSLKP
jgi:outer membrane protein OmpA-like peptidoglycan-associated protein